MIHPSKTIIFLFSIIYTFSIQASDLREIRKDSASRKIIFHGLISTQPIVNWIHPISTGGTFFNSTTRFEVQVSYKRHYIGFGANYQSRVQDQTVNPIPSQVNKINSTWSPFYYYNLASYSRWKISVGAAYLVKTERTKISLLTDIENISDTWQTRERALVLLNRLNYRVNKHLSFEIESAYLFSFIKDTFKEEYPLTPSLFRSSENKRRSNGYSVPSNIFIKYSF